MSQAPGQTNRPAAGSQPQLSASNGEDNLVNTDWWQLVVNYQADRNRGQQLAGCLFGDSISSGLGNTLGEGNVNFALAGMSTTSLIAQMQQIVTANVRCRQVVIAIGTNDAWYGIDDQHFTAQLKQSLGLARSLGATKITLIPAFYSTVPASEDPTLAGPIPRIDELNLLINQVAKEANVTVAAAGIQPLFKNHALDASLTEDGVHLNEAGKKIYRQALTAVFANSGVEAGR